MSYKLNFAEIGNSVLDCLLRCNYEKPDFTGVIYTYIVDEI